MYGILFLNANKVKKSIENFDFLTDDQKGQILQSLQMEAEKESLKTILQEKVNELKETYSDGISKSDLEDEIETFTYQYVNLGYLEVMELITSSRDEFFDIMDESSYTADFGEYSKGVLISFMENYIREQMEDCMEDNLDDDEDID